MPSRRRKAAPIERPALFVEQLVAEIDMERLTRPVGYYDIAIETPTGTVRARRFRWEHATEGGATWRPTLVVEAE